MGRTALKAIQAAAGSAGGDFYPYTIDNSARFEGNNYLYRTYGGNTKTFTLSFWVKRAPGNGLTPGYFQVITGGIYYAPGGYYFLLWPNTAGGRWLSQPDPAISSIFNDPGNTGRDFSAWYHYVFAFDSTQATSTDRMKVWVNGVQQPWTGTYPALNHNVEQFAGTMYIGRDSSTGQPVEKAGGGNSYGYLADIAITDGQYYSASDFGEFKNGAWVPKDLSGLNFGTKGFWLDFKDSSNFGNDVSGNNLDFTAVGFQTHDQMIDTPTNNFATLNPLLAGTISDGNLYHTYGSGTYDNASSTMSVTSGKWYTEFTIGIVSVYPGFGITEADSAIGTNPSMTDYLGSTAGGGYGYYPGSGFYRNSSLLQSPTATIASGSVVGLALDLDSSPRTLKIYDDGVLVETLSNIDLPSSGYLFCSSINSGGSGGSARWNFGQSSFAHTPPTDHLALSTANLPEPAIGPNSATTSGENFNTVLYTGNGSSQNVTGFGFDPDMVWHKGRSVAYSHSIVDVIRGNSNVIFTNTTDVEQNPGAQLDLITDGATVTYRSANLANNQSGATYVIWGWKGNGSGVTNTDGSITSTVSANTNSGFSIVTYTGTSSAGTIGHGLGVAPEMIICKARDVNTSWPVYHSGLSSAAYALYFDLTNAQGSFPTLWNSTAPTSSVFSVGTGGNQSNGNGYSFLAYCFAEVESFSSFGSYIGNGSADGPFIFTGFRPAWVVIKRTDAASDWVLWDEKRDPYNYMGRELQPDKSDAELALSEDLDFLSNGFKLRRSGTNFNGSGASYIYMAFAENPFKYANAR